MVSSESSAEATGAESGELKGEGRAQTAPRRQAEAGEVANQLLHPAPRFPECLAGAPPQLRG